MTLAAILAASLAACGKEASSGGPAPAAPSSGAKSNAPPVAAETSATTAATSVAAAAPGPTVTDFPSKDPNAWVNGAPLSIAESRGDVVLVESWHRL